MSERRTLWFTALLALLSLAAHTIVIALGRGGNPQYGLLLCSKASLQGYSVSKEIYFYYELTLSL